MDKTLVGGAQGEKGGGEGAQGEKGGLRVAKTYGDVYLLPISAHDEKEERM